MVNPALLHDLADRLRDQAAELDAFADQLEQLETQPAPSRPRQPVIGARPGTPSVEALTRFMLRTKRRD